MFWQDAKTPLDHFIIAKVLESIHSSYFTQDCILRLVTVKGTDIVVFKMIQREPDHSLLCLSCEIAPSCHANPITSLQCVSNKFILTASWSATQYFDIGKILLLHYRFQFKRRFQFNSSESKELLNT